MFGYVMIGYFVGTAILWITFFIQSHRLLYEFVRKHPEQASKDLPTPGLAHPGKLFYFFESSSKKFLEQDPEIWQLRQQVKILGLLSLTLPPGIFLTLLLYAVHMGSIQNQ